MIRETSAPVGLSMASFRSRLKPLLLERSAREGRVISQSEVARETGLSFATIQRLYDGNFDRIDAKTLYGLLDYFGCTFDELIERVNE
jgi:transcriptional regulator with XRE-family HTH domain